MGKAATYQAEGFAARVGATRYGSGNVALMVYDADAGEWFGDVTADLAETLPEGWAAIDTKAAPWALSLLCDNGIARWTGATVRHEGWECPLCVIDLDAVG